MKCMSAMLAMTVATWVAPAWAQSESAEMHVSGSVTAAASCSISISNGGVVDFGHIPYASLSQSSTTDLGTTTRTATVLCDTPTRFAIGVFDNRADTLNPSMLSCGHCLGMGSTAAQRPVGFYALEFLDDPIVDGVAQTIMFSNDLSSWEMFFGNFLTPQDRTPSSNGRKFVAAGSGSPVVIAATTLSIQFHVHAFLESRDTMAITQPTAIDGSSTLEIIYL
jgi:hypothetical protein